MSITIELCNYDHTKKCLYCEYNGEGFCYNYNTWCNLAVEKCTESIVTLQVRAKRNINRCRVYKYIPSLDAKVNPTKKIYRVREGKGLFSRLLSDEQVDQIVEKYNDGAKVEELAEWYFVSQGTIRKYLREKTKLRGDRSKPKEEVKEVAPVQQVINKVYDKTIEIVKQVVEEHKSIITKEEDKPMNCKGCIRMSDAKHKLEKGFYISNMQIAVELLEELMKDARKDGMTGEQIIGDVDRIVSFIKDNI